MSLIIGKLDAASVEALDDEERAAVAGHVARTDQGMLAVALAAMSRKAPRAFAALVNEVSALRRETR